MYDMREHALRHVDGGSPPPDSTFAMYTLRSAGPINTNICDNRLSVAHPYSWIADLYFILFSLTTIVISIQEKDPLTIHAIVSVSTIIYSRLKEYYFIFYQENHLSSNYKFVPPSRSYPKTEEFQNSIVDRGVVQIWLVKVWIWKRTFLWRDSHLRRRKQNFQKEEKGEGEKSCCKFEP